jgi:hypothetical protein
MRRLVIVITLAMLLTGAVLPSPTSAKSVDRGPAAALPPSRDFFGVLLRPLSRESVYSLAASAAAGPLADPGPLLDYCVANVGLTLKDTRTSTIQGSGSMACWNGTYTRIDYQHLQVTLQRHVMGRWWTNLDNNERWTWSAQNWALSVGWYCGNRGTYTYRVIVTAWASATQLSLKHITLYSNQLRISC